MTENIDRFLRLDDVHHITVLGRNTVYRRIREGTFPNRARSAPTRWPGVSRQSRSGCLPYAQSIEGFVGGTQFCANTTPRTI
ncbi:AlpA family phage regulatory protein [Pseudomonas sp. V88_4]|uniref:helix-turn-helix transcriptional regulator n=1 Tax=Pseudomonas sp. V88_4 TaxID=3044229 RepID=UPI0032B70D09